MGANCGQVDGTGTTAATAGVCDAGAAADFFAGVLPFFRREAVAGLGFGSGAALFAGKYFVARLWPVVLIFFAPSSFFTDKTNSFVLVFSFLAISSMR